MKDKTLANRGREGYGVGGDGEEGLEIRKKCGGWRSEV